MLFSPSCGLLPVCGKNRDPLDTNHDFTPRGQRSTVPAVAFLTHWLAISTWPIVIGLIGFVMAAHGRGHWSFTAAAMGHQPLCLGILLYFLLDRLAQASPYQLTMGIDISVQPE